MKFSLIPKEQQFFDLLDQMGLYIEETAAALEDLATNYTDVDVKINRINGLEHACDEVCHDCLDKLETTFITPFDRDSIHRLITKMDDILDLAEAVSERISVYEMTTPTDEAKQLARVLVFSAEEVGKAVRGLRSMKNAQEILKRCVEINRLENEADTLLRLAVGKLFKTERDPLTVMKWKELYEGLEEATDRCEDVANLVEGIVLEFA